ncbi:MAG: amidohydrolase family protein [Pirellulales bacterium]|nr:amidohydrolase family protein [Pirellulales bacterium]
MNARRVSIAVVLLGLVVADGRAAPPAKVALQGGRIIPVEGEEIAQGTLLIENGKITAVGAQVEIPYDAMVVDVSGKVLLPGMISPHTWRGLDRANENLPVAPYLDVYDAIDPSSLAFEDALRDGVLAVHVIQGDSCVIGGLSRLVHPIGRTPDEMTIRPAIALKLSTSPRSGFDRMSQMAAMREAFFDLGVYLEDLAETRYEAELKKQEKQIDVPPEEARKRGRELIRDEDLDDKHANLLRLIEKRLDAWIYCGAATDVAPAIGTARENGFLERSVFVLGVDAYRAVDELKQAGRPVVLPPELVHQERDPITGELRETFVPKVIHDAGLLFALQPDPDASLAERYLTYQAARCVRRGIPREAALQAITLNPAKMLGVADRLGSLQVGKAGYVVVLSGDPLDFNTWVEQAYIDGILAYDRAKDVRLQELLGLEEKAKKAADAKTAKAEEAKKVEEEKKEGEKKEDEAKEDEGKEDEKEKDEGKEDEKKQEKQPELPQDQPSPPDGEEP